MTEEAFVRARAPFWDELALTVEASRGLAHQTPERLARAVGLYRSLCADLMRAESAGFGPEVTGRLHALAARAHAAIYQRPGRRRAALFDLLRGEFPRALRREKGLFLLALVLFLLPALVGFFGARGSRTFALRVLPGEVASQMEDAYAHGFGEGRDEGTDAAMAGFYIHNNIGIAFRCFATGLLFGLGSAFFLLFNGLQIGAVFGLVTAAGHGPTIFVFGVGHGPFELTAIVIAGTAGLVMGRALLVTDGETRVGSLRRQAPTLFALVAGAAVMLALAAGIEAFWSPAGMSVKVKVAVGALNTTFVASYLVFAGRGRRRPA